jgi:polyisoprenoid-binding protein YceI
MGAGLKTTLALLITAVALPAVAETQWESRADGSELRFSAWYEGEEIPGRFGRFSVRLGTGAADGEPISLTVEVRMSSADMNDGEVNQELAEPEWFGTAAHPAARFVSEDIVPADGGFLARGQLQIKDVERPLDVPFAWLPDGRKGSLTGAVELSRLAWRVGAGEWASDASLADRVRVSFDVDMQRAE